MSAHTGLDPVYIDFLEVPFIQKRGFGGSNKFSSQVSGSFWPFMANTQMAHF